MGALLAAAGDALAEWQDSLHKGEVTDHDIFRCAARSASTLFSLLAMVTGHRLQHERSDGMPALSTLPACCFPCSTKACEYYREVHGHAVCSEALKLLPEMT